MSETLRETMYCSSCNLWFYSFHHGDGTLRDYMEGMVEHRIACQIEHASEPFEVDVVTGDILFE